MSQGGIIAQLEVFSAWDIEGFAQGQEGLGLFDGIDAQVGFQIQVRLEHVHRVAGFFRDNLQDLVIDIRFACRRGQRLNLGGLRRRHSGWLRGQAR